MTIHIRTVTRVIDISNRTKKKELKVELKRVVTVSVLISCSRKINLV